MMGLACRLQLVVLPGRQQAGADTALVWGGGRVVNRRGGNGGHEGRDLKHTDLLPLHKLPHTCTQARTHSKGCTYGTQSLPIGAWAVTQT